MAKSSIPKISPCPDGQRPHLKRVPEPCRRSSNGMRIHQMGYKRDRWL